MCSMRLPPCWPVAPKTVRRLGIVGGDVRGVEDGEGGNGGGSNRGWICVRGLFA